MLENSESLALEIEKGAYLLRWVMTIALAILALVIDPKTIDAPPGVRGTFMVLIAIAVAYNSAVGILLLRKMVFKGFGYVLLLVDTALIGSAVAATGGIYSNLYLLFPVFAITATARYGKQGAIVASAWIIMLLSLIWLLSRDPLSTRGLVFITTRTLYLLLVSFFAATMGNIKEDAHKLKAMTEKAELVLENAGLYEQLRESYLRTVMSLTEAVEAKDTHTRGHSEEVAVIAKAIAMKMDLPEALQEDIYYAGLLHDVGKIGTPESILTKPTSLTQQEYEQVMLHPSKGYEIVKPVAPHNGIATYVLMHHEH
ncbi:MAG: HD domain-containing protein, partial [Chloroflexi bacterium]|nr:HD domain-containing protein [Chloroflexota bacterium]